MKLEDLFESPQMTFPTNFGLKNTLENTKLAQDYLRDSRKIPLQKFGNGTHTLYEFPRAFILINHTNDKVPLIVYIMKYKVEFFKFLNANAAQQITVWRNSLNRYTKTIAETIFFDYLVKHHKTVITDSLQTSDGGRFWEVRVSDAFRKGLNVYYVNLMTPREIIKLTDEANFDQVTSNKETWGDAQKHHSRRIVISEKELNLP